MNKHEVYYKTEWARYDLGIDSKLPLWCWWVVKHQSSRTNNMVPYCYSISPYVLPFSQLLSRLSIKHILMHQHRYAVDDDGILLWTKIISKPKKKNHELNNWSVTKRSTKSNQYCGWREVHAQSIFQRHLAGDGKRSKKWGHQSLTSAHAAWCYTSINWMKTGQPIW